MRRPTGIVRGKVKVKVHKIAETVAVYCLCAHCIQTRKGGGSTAAT